MTNFIKYEEHGVVESSALLGTHGGEHQFNLVAPSTDVENGSIVALGKFAGGDVWEVKVPAVGDDVFLIVSEAKNDEIQGMPLTKDERFFYNGKGEVMLGVHLGKYDKFAVSPNMISGAPAVGKFVVADGKTMKLTAVATAPADNAFVGEIYDVATNGNYRVLVKKNG